MNPWFAKAVVLLASIGLVAIRAPHGQRSRSVQVAKNRKGTLEVVLLTMAWVGFFVPLIWVATPALGMAEYALSPAALVIGTACLAMGLWLLYRSHADLGTNWSITLEVRENHQLVTNGIYRHIRHPMYSALLLYSLGQAIAVPNWIAGPSYLLTMGLLVVLRLGPEERMMVEQFGSGYEEYVSKTKRLIPRVW